MRTKQFARVLDHVSKGETVMSWAVMVHIASNDYTVDVFKREHLTENVARAMFAAHNPNLNAVPADGHIQCVELYEGPHLREMKG